MKRLNKKKLMIFVVIIIVLIFLISLLFKEEDFITYKGEKYICLQYNMDIFVYNYNGNEYYEEDTIKPITHNKWKMVYFNGDIFVHKDDIKEAEKYYSSDKNYDWYMVTYENDTENLKTIKLSKKEKEYIYDMENKKKSKTIVFDDIEEFGDLIKISKDETVYAITSLAYIDNKWYWKTERMTDDNREYVIELPETLNKKIKQKN